MNTFSYILSLPDVDPRSDRFRRGGRESKFMATNSLGRSSES